MAQNSIPSIDFSLASSQDHLARRQLVDNVRQACEVYGFFQVTNHGIPQELLDSVLKQSEKLFSLPLETKEKYTKDQDRYNRGYERLRAQNFEKKTAGDLKEGWYFGQDLSPNHPKVIAEKFNLGPNKYPEEIEHPKEFRDTIDQYHAKVLSLAGTIFSLLCQTLDVDDSWIPDLVETPIAILRLLHYPPQAEDASEDERGIGAHTDFGVLTILLQDMIGGLQVWDRQKSQWADVTPTKGAFVVNLGNLMMRWTNDRYISNLHRVINRSGQARYSIPFFFNGNPDFLVKCFESCRDAQGNEKYPPITIEEWIGARYADTYGTGVRAGAGELSTAEAAAASSSLSN